MPENRAPLFALLREFGTSRYLAPTLVKQLYEKTARCINLAAFERPGRIRQPSRHGRSHENGYATATKDVRHRIRDIFFSRPTALAFLQSIDSGETKAQTTFPSISSAASHCIRTNRSTASSTNAGATSALAPQRRKLATMRCFNNDLRAATVTRRPANCYSKKTAASATNSSDRATKSAPISRRLIVADWPPSWATLSIPAPVIRS